MSPVHPEAKDPVDRTVTERLQRASTASLATLLFKRGLRNQFIQGVFRLGAGRGRMVGPAYTLRYIPAREDLDVVEAFRDPDHPQRVAVETVPEGHVLVMDCRRDASAASAGSILAARLEVRGCAGLVTDGGLRDSDDIAALDMPSFCGSRSAPTNLTRHHAVDLQVPIGCGGVAVYPGDILVGDGDGVMVIPQEIVEEISLEAAEMERFEAFVMTEIRSGRPVIGTYPPDAETVARYQASLQGGRLEIV